MEKSRLKSPWTMESAMQPFERLPGLWDRMGPPTEPPPKPDVPPAKPTPPPRPEDVPPRPGGIPEEPMAPDPGPPHTPAPEPPAPPIWGSTARISPGFTRRSVREMYMPVPRTPGPPAAKIGYFGS